MTITKVSFEEKLYSEETATVETEIDAKSNSWDIIDIELRHRRLSWASLGRTIDASPQTMNNWRKLKKIPSSRLASIAGYFGWTIEQVMAGSPSKASPERQPDRADEHIDPTYSQRAHTLAEMFDELRDPAIRQIAYTAVQAMLKLAIAGQRLPNSPALTGD